MCVAKSNVRFAPNCDRERGFPQKVMSASPPKPDMCSALAHVCFGPKADILSGYNGVDRHVEIEMEQLGSGLLAGISVPNTPIISDALDYAQRLSEPYLFNHAVRSWLFAISIARAKNLDYDSE